MLITKEMLAKGYPIYIEEGYLPLANSDFKEHNHIFSINTKFTNKKNVDESLLKFSSYQCNDLNFLFDDFKANRFKLMTYKANMEQKKTNVKKGGLNLAKFLCYGELVSIAYYEPIYVEEDDFKFFSVQTVHFAPSLLVTIKFRFNIFLRNKISDFGKWLSSAALNGYWQKL